MHITCPPYEILLQRADPLDTTTAVTTPSILKPKQLDCALYGNLIVRHLRLVRQQVGRFAMAFCARGNQQPSPDELHVIAIDVNPHENDDNRFGQLGPRPHKRTKYTRVRRTYILKRVSNDQIFFVDNSARRLKWRPPMICHLLSLVFSTWQ